MNDEPSIEDRPERLYLGLRAVMPMGDFPRQVPAMTAKVLEGLADRGLAPSGKPFLRYHVIDMPDRMDVELGIPVSDAANAANAADPDDADGQLSCHSLPGGRYAVLTYKGVRDGVLANKRLLDWIAAQRQAVAKHGSDAGDVFEARYETVLTDAQAVLDQDEWETEVAIKLR